MRLAGDIRSAIDWVQKDGLSAVPDAAYGFYKTYVLGGIGRYLNQGENVYERDWDVLLILDACRLDLFHSVSDEYEFITTTDQLYSVGGNSEEWMRKTFTDEYEQEIKQTAYITGNPFSERVLDSDDFLVMDEVWKYAWSEQGTVLPEAISDRAIETHREHQPEYMIVHYMQPHVPFVNWDKAENISISNFGGPQSKRTMDTWDRVRKGEVKLDDVMKAYRNNLRLVLDQLEVVLSSIDAERVVISSDHGNAIGEFGVYGHPRSAPLKGVRAVPWSVTSARNNGEYQPALEKGMDAVTDDDVESRLQDLGYI